MPSKDTEKNNRYRLVELFAEPGEKILNFIDKIRPPILVGLVEFIGGAFALAFGSTPVKLAGLAAMLHGSTIFEIEVKEEPHNPSGEL